MYERSEKGLIDWFKDTFKERTNKLETKDADVRDVLPGYRVCWSEVWQKAVEFGIIKNNNEAIFNFRLRWDEIEPKRWAKDLERKRNE